MVRRKVRIRFRKVGDLRLFGHLDLLRTWERLFRRAGVRLSMTEGFHPRPRMRFPAPLPLGEAGLDEVLEVDVADDQPVELLQTLLAEQAPAGLEVARVDELAADAAAGEVCQVTYRLPLPDDRLDDVRQRLATLLSGTSLPVARREGRTLDLRDRLEAAAIDDDALVFTLRVGREANLRARDVLAALALADLCEQGVYPTRTHVELAG